MKKLLAVLLAVLCTFSVFSASAINDDALGEIIGDQFGVTSEPSEDEILSYGIHYEVATLSTVTLLYIPSASITFETPCDMVVTNDTPVAVDHNWVCWKDKETGELYYPGDVIEVNGKVTLIAVWEEKTDNYPRFIRSAIAGVQALIRVVQKFLGVFELINSTETTASTDVPAETTTVPAE